MTEKRPRRPTVLSKEKWEEIKPEVLAMRARGISVKEILEHIKTPTFQPSASILYNKLAQEKAESDRAAAAGRIVKRDEDEESSPDQDFDAAKATGIRKVQKRKRRSTATSVPRASSRPRLNEGVTGKAVDMHVIENLDVAEESDMPDIDSEAGVAEADAVSLAELPERHRILEAAKAKNLRVMRSLLTNDITLVNTVDSDMFAPIHYSVLADHVKGVQLLTSHGSDVAVQTNKRMTPLHLVKSRDVALALLEGNADPNVRDDAGNTPLHMTITTNLDVPLIVALVKAGAQPNIKNNAGITPFEALLSLDPLDDITLMNAHLAVRFFLKYSNPSVKEAFSNGVFPFAQFVQKLYTNQLEGEPAKILHEIIEIFVDLAGDTPALDLSAPLRSSESFILDYIRSQPPLTEQIDSLEAKLISHCPVTQIGPDHNTVLHVLCSYGGLGALNRGIDQHISTLLNRGANPNARNEIGQTPLAVVFCVYSNTEKFVERTVQQLMRRGGDMWLDDSSCMTPFDRAAKYIVRRKFSDSKSIEFLAKMFELDQSLENHTMAISQTSVLAFWIRISSMKSWSEVLDLLTASPNESLAQRAMVTAIAKKFGLKALEMIGTGDHDAKLEGQRRLRSIVKACRHLKVPVDEEFVEQALSD